MLDFLLVLGQIPGTNIELSFWQIVFSVLGTGFVVKIWRRPDLRRKCIHRFKFSAFNILYLWARRQRQN